MLTEIYVGVGVAGGWRPSAEWRRQNGGDRGRRVRQCRKGRVSPRTSLFDGAGVVVGKRHRIRFRARRRLLSPQINTKELFEFVKPISNGIIWSFTLKLASDPFRRWRNSMAGLPGSVSEVSMLSLGLHSLVETIFMEDMVLLQKMK
jgi:hypothetical protein